MGIMAAFIFVAQILNFPIIGGTSGHFMGAALAAIVIGPWAAILIMSCILIVQCLVFQDGGLLALGANIFNMGIIGSLTGYYSFLLINKIFGSSKKSMVFAWFLAGWMSIMAAAIVCSIELAISGIINFTIVFTTMVGWHTLIGIGEGLISIAILSFILANRADLLKLEKV
jgi:cobalt/nickel transport system permease protein